MIIKTISAYNFKGFSSVSVNIDERITYLVGPNGAGKSGIGVDIIWWVLQGIAEKSSGGNVPLLGERFRFIGTGSAAAIGDVVLYDEEKKVEIRVIRKMLKSHSEVSFSCTDPKMKLDQKWLNDLFNVFFIAPKRFLDLSSKDQALTLGIDTKKWDDKLADLKNDVTIYNRDIKKIEDLPFIDKVEKIELEPLQKQMKELQASFVADHRANQEKNKVTKKEWEDECKEWDAYCKQFNAEQKKHAAERNDVGTAVVFLESIGFRNGDLTAFYQSFCDKVHPDIYPENFYSPEPTDLQYKPADYVPVEGERVYVSELPNQQAIIDLNEKIIAATETNHKAKAYDEYQEKLKEKDELHKKLAENKAKQAELQAEKLDYVKAFKLPFDKLSIGDEGELLFNGRPLKAPHFSSGELIRIIPTLLSSLNPKLKYVFLQDFDLLDDANKEKTIAELTGLGFQLVVEHIGTEPVRNENCIVLRNSSVVEEYKAPVKADDAKLITE